ncbi:MAG TPA: transposase [Steroidobacteraceae bacterium]|jgi:putative transposase|nr:transposase [Steroidobacteraceae bacterium]
MPRPPRLHVPGGVYHVILRGNHRQAIFTEPSDRQMLDALVAETLERFDARAHAYCWMTNHMHLALQVADAPLGPIVRRIAGVYARRIQQRLPTTGHLFERRYRSVLVDADTHLLRLVRYIHLNPLRAGLVADPADYPWSGHRAYLGLTSIPWLTTDFTLRLLGTNRNSARRAYARLISAGGDPDDSAQFSRGMPGDTRVLGDDGFLARITATGSRVPPTRPSLPTLEQVIAAAAREAGCTVEALASASKARAVADARCRVTERALAAGIASISEIARRLNRSHSSLIEALQRRR